MAQAATATIRMFSEDSGSAFATVATAPALNRSGFAGGSNS